MRYEGLVILWKLRQRDLVVVSLVIHSGNKQVMRNEGERTHVGIISFRLVMIEGAGKRF